MMDNVHIDDGERGAEGLPKLGNQGRHRHRVLTDGGMDILGVAFSLDEYLI